MKEKTFITVINNAFVERSLLKSDFLPLLRKEYDSIVLCVREAEAAYFKETYEDDQVTVVPTPRRLPLTSLQRKLYTFLKYSIHTYESKVKRLKVFYSADGTGIQSFRQLFYYLPFTFTYHISRFRFWRQFLRFLYKQFSEETLCLDILETYKPTIAYIRYTTVSNDDFNLRLMSACKAKGIPVVGNVFSWDNLYSKVFIPFHTDHLTVPNEIVKKEAMRLADFEEKNISVVGLPHFDFYFKDDFKMSREDFFAQIGADPTKKLVLFAGALEATPVNYQHFFMYFTELAKGPLADTQFYLRSHPKTSFAPVLSTLSDTTGLILEKKPKMDQFRFAENDSKILYNLMYHADMILCLYSTLLMEAGIFDKPIVVVNYSGGVTCHPIYSIKQRPNYEHIRQILEQQCVTLVNSDEELLKEVQHALAHKKNKSQERQDMVLEQLSKHKGKAAQRLFDVITNFEKTHV